MESDDPGSTALISGHPVLLVLAAFPIACFSGTLVTDIVYAWTADMIWADFSAWLLAVGIFAGVIAAIVGMVELVVRRRVWSHRRVWPFVIGSLGVLILALFDNLVHSRDAWTSVVPAGLALSAMTVVVMLGTVWLGAGSPTRARATSTVRVPS